MLRRSGRWVAALAALMIASTALAGCSSKADEKSGGGEGATPGVSADTITLGALSALTGTFAAGAKRQLAGAELYWKEVNDAGGVCGGRTVTIEARDNAYDPQRTVSAYGDISPDVLALQLITGTAMTQAIADSMERDDMSSIPMSWSPDLLGKPSILIPGTTYDVDMMNAVDFLLDQGKLAQGDTIGYIYFPGDFGGAGFAGAEKAGQAHGITVDAYEVDPTATDLSSQISTMAKNGTKAVFLSVSPPLLANAAAVAATEHLDVPFVVPTPTFVPDLLQSDAATQVARETYVVSPYDAWTGSAPGMADLRKAFAADGDGGTPQQFFIAGYAAAQVMHNALERTCAAGDLTRENLAKSFADSKAFAMHGLSVDLDFSDRAVPPALQDYILRVDASAAGGLTPVQAEPYQGADAAPLLSGK
ncbi:ABC transporter substrate-binding protein [Nocardioides sp. GXZ039]|uniref:ABC transporter substrate-binding protein n=1 Tax=Nocardioides sp. GXZ039 TaxID=3136018 RepID=UPI0030F398A3